MRTSLTHSEAEGDRSMSSANLLLAKHDFPPKNGPVPNQLVNGYQSGRQQREVYYAGQVQGVGFRYTVRSLALRFDVTGFVRNLPDGRVHLVVEGAGDDIGTLLDEIKAEMSRYVEDVQETVRPASGRFSSFSIRF